MCAIKVQTLNEELGARSLEIFYSVVSLYLRRQSLLAYYTRERLFWKCMMDSGLLMYSESTMNRV